jgi:hypothetical protein
MRFKVKNRAFAVLRNHVSRLGQIMDISRGGLALKYLADQGRVNGTFHLDIFSSGRGFLLKGIPFTVVSDFETDQDVPFGSVEVRRCGVRFGQLMDNQAILLQYFIDNHTRAEQH